MKSSRIFYLWMILMLGCFNASAEVVLPKILGHNMVLQCNKPVPIWGTAAAGEKVTIKFANQTKTITTDTTGNWKVMLDPMAASANPATLTISGTNTIKLHNILVGEVWLCSGQSNMSYEMRKNSKVKKPDTSTTNSPVDELDRAHNPNIRIFLVTQKNLAKPDPANAGWDIAQDSALRVFSAAGYFFAKNLNHELNVPIGIICAAVSGSRIEPWIPETAFNNSTYFKSISKDSSSINGADGKFYHRMIELLAPMALRGFLWYQGEANMTETVSYAHKMQLLINSWRTTWSDQSLPFYYVQIAPYLYSKMPSKRVITPETEAYFWETQAQVMNIPHTGMIVTNDLNDDVNNLHPLYKWEVGHRLALLALAKTYKKKVVYSGPVYQGMKVRGNTIELTFKYANGGLISNNHKPLDWFTIAGTDGKFVPAEAVIKGDKVIVSATDVAKPAAVRFAWNESAQPNLFNKSGLPARPFRTDHPLKISFTDNQ